MSAIAALAPIPAAMAATPPAAAIFMDLLTVGMVGERPFGAGCSVLPLELRDCASSLAHTRGEPVTALSDAAAVDRRAGCPNGRIGP